MQHIELLDYILSHKEYWTSLRAQKWVKVPAFEALESVVKIHHPWKYAKDEKLYCSECDMKYPCKTIRIVEKELGR